MLERNRKTILIPSSNPSQAAENCQEMNLLEELFDEILEHSPHQETESLVSNPQFDPLQHLPQVHPPEYYRREKNKQKKKRRCINPKTMPEIRVLRSDSRRKYGEMMINVTNNTDISLYEQFFKEFGMPDLRSVFRRSVANKVTRTVDDVVFNGHNPGFSNLSQLVGAYALNAAMMPDWHFTMENCQIRMRQGYQGSVIVMKTLARGTRVFSVEPKGVMMKGAEDTEGNSSDSSVSTQIETSDSSLASKGSSLTPAPNPFEQRSFKRLEEAGYIDRVNYRWVIADPPLDTTAEVIFVMILDEMHHIQQYHIDYNLISEKPISYPYSYSY